MKTDEVQSRQNMENICAQAGIVLCSVLVKGPRFSQSGFQRWLMAFGNEAGWKSLELL